MIDHRSRQTHEIERLRLSGWTIEELAQRFGDDAIAEHSKQQAAKAPPGVKMQLAGLSRQAAIAFATGSDTALPWPTRMQAIQSYWQLLNRYEALLRTVPLGS